MGSVFSRGRQPHPSNKLSKLSYTYLKQEKLQCDPKYKPGIGFHANVGSSLSLVSDGAEVVKTMSEVSTEYSTVFSARPITTGEIFWFQVGNIDSSQVGCLILNT